MEVLAARNPPAFAVSLPLFSLSSRRKLCCRCRNLPAASGDTKRLPQEKFYRRTFSRNLVTVTLIAVCQGLFVPGSFSEEDGSRRSVADEEDLKTIQEALRKALKRSKAAGILRLVFHDAGTFNCIEHTGGMNGSILFELDRPENIGLHKSIEILDPVKASLESSMKVSWADLIAVAGAEAVSICGGPKIPVNLGRLDVVVADGEGELPAEWFNASALKENFSKKGLTARELVVLSGAHTLGGKGFGNPSIFDNSYFKVLLQKPWTQIGNEMGSMTGLPSDRSLVDDKECLRWINYYANDEAKFFEDFSSAYIKLTNAGVKWQTVGVRQQYL